MANESDQSNEGAVAAQKAPRSRTKLSADIADVEAQFDFRTQIAQEEWDHRKTLSKEIMGSFLTVNILVLKAVAFIFFLDLLLLDAKLISPGDRLIDTKVLIAIVSAITVQFGAIAFAVAAWLFPKTGAAQRTKSP